MNLILVWTCFDHKEVCAQLDPLIVGMTSTVPRGLGVYHSSIPGRALSRQVLISRMPQRTVHYQAKQTLQHRQSGGKIRESLWPEQYLLLILIHVIHLPHSYNVKLTCRGKRSRMCDTQFHTTAIDIHLVSAFERLEPRGERE